jgi:hypothetical protein
MKTTIFTISSVLILIFLFIASQGKTERLLSNKVNKKSFAVTKEIQTLNNKEVSTHQSVIEKTLAHVKNVDELRNDLGNLTDKEITLRLKETQKEIEEQGLIQKANRSELDEQTATKLVELMRTNEALNSISLDRKIKRFERKYI